MSTILRSVCPHDCPDTCGMMVSVENGIVTRCEGDSAHPFTNGFLCDKVRRYPERTYSPDRLLHPLQRVGKKGEGRFERISWEKALETITSRLKGIISEFGPSSVLPFHYGGTMGAIQNSAGTPFFHRLGASMILGTICDTVSEEAWLATYGKTIGTDIESAAESDCVVIWGMNAAVTNLHGMPFLLEAKKKGAKLYVIDPYRTDTAKHADVHLMPKPGTDAALAMGVARILIEEGLINQKYIERNTFGFAAYRDRVLNDYPLDRCSKICGVGPDQIRSFALDYGKANAPFMRIGIGFARHPNGGQAFRSVCVLPGLVGAYAKKGGGAVYETSGAFELNWGALKRPDLAPKPPRMINMIRLGEALMELQDPPIKALFVYNCNPASIVPNQSRVVEGLRREDLFTVVAEQMNTDTVDYADIVLPATTSLEHFDLYKSYGHYYLQLAQPVIPPVGESKSNLEIFQRLAKMFGFEDEHFRKSPNALAREAVATASPFRSGITWEKLVEGKPVRLNHERFADPFKNGFYTESKKLEFFSMSLEKIGKDPLPGYVENPEGHERRNGSLQLLTPPSKYMLNSSFGGVETLRHRAGKARIKIHPVDARSRKIHSDQLLRVWNDRGEIFLHAEITDDVQPGVAVAEAVRWSKHSPGGKGVNTLTSDRLSDIGEGSTFHSALVQVSPA